MLSAAQKQEIIDFILEIEHWGEFTANMPYAISTAEQPLTEIWEGDLYFCLEQREVSVRGQKIDLTAREFNTLHLLIINRKRVMTFETIAYHVWGSDVEVNNELGAIHNIMSRIRKKVKITPDIPDYIISVRGVGYKFDIEP